jgi:hypothetical protein
LGAGIDRRVELEIGIEQQADIDRPGENRQEDRGADGEFDRGDAGVFVRSQYP